MRRGLGQCALHPEVPAVEICERCGAFACGNCVEFTQGVPSQTLCSTCHSRYFSQKASQRAVAGLVLGLVGISMCWVLGIVAWILGQQELEAIDRCEAPEQGRNLATGAKWLGLIQLGLMVLAAVIAALVYIT